MRAFFALSLFLSLFWSPAIATAREIAGYLPFEELLRKSDLVIIAEPQAETKDSSDDDIINLPGILSKDLTDPKATGAALKARGVETPFRILAILKGPSELKTIILHHYRELYEKPSMNPPNLFRIGRRTDGYSFLLFLIRESDGRYAPVTGQTDPGATCIFHLGS